MDDLELDLRGLKCPLPALKTARALARLPPGGVLVVTATDPLATLDIPHAVREGGGRVEAQHVDGPVATFRIRRP